MLPGRPKVDLACLKQVAAAPIKITRRPRGTNDRLAFCKGVTISDVTVGQRLFVVDGYHACNTATGSASYSRLLTHIFKGITL